MRKTTRRFTNWTKHRQSSWTSRFHFCQTRFICFVPDEIRTRCIMRSADNLKQHQMALPVSFFGLVLVHAWRQCWTHSRGSLRTLILSVTLKSWSFPENCLKGDNFEATIGERIPSLAIMNGPYPRLKFILLFRGLFCTQNLPCLDGKLRLCTRTYVTFWGNSAENIQFGPRDILRPCLNIRALPEVWCCNLNWERSSSVGTETPAAAASVQGKQWYACNVVRWNSFHRITRDKSV